MAPDTQLLIVSNTNGQHSPPPRSPRLHPSPTLNATVQRTVIHADYPDVGKTTVDGMDAPIHVAGELYGVVCHEHVGPPRKWMPDEQLVAIAIANLVAQAVSQHK